MDHDTITDAIIRSQHCQRNWDLDQEIPENDLKLLVTSVTQCPSKQNIAFYKLHFITNREIIEKIHAQTSGFVVKYEPTIEYTTNSQTLANLVVVFENYFDVSHQKDINRNDETRVVNGIEITEKTDLDRTKRILKKDQLLSIGIAAGYLNLTSNLLGYATGCCTCFDAIVVKEILNLENDPLLIMGIGYKDINRNRRLHHHNNFQFPTRQKQPISVNYIK